MFIDDLFETCQPVSLQLAEVLKFLLSSVSTAESRPHFPLHLLCSFYFFINKTFLKLPFDFLLKVNIINKTYTYLRETISLSKKLFHFFFYPVMLFLYLTSYAF